MNLNTKQLSEKVGLEEYEYVELLTLFLETGMGDLKQLQAAIHAADLEQIMNIAHTFKGAAMNLGLKELTEIAKMIEISTGEDQMKNTAHNFQTLKQELDIIADFIKLQQRVHSP